MNYLIELDFFLAMIVMFVVFFSFNKIAVSTKNLILYLGFSRIVPNIGISLVNIAQSWFTISAVDVVHLQGSGIRKPALHAFISKNIEDFSPLSISNAISQKPVPFSFSKLSRRYFFHCPNVFVVSFSVFFKHIAIIPQEWIAEL